MDQDLIREYLAEAQEYLTQAEQSLLILENVPTDKESLRVVYRAFHSLKGVSGFVGMTCVSQLSHAAESLFDHLMKGQIPVDPTAISAALATHDVLGEMLQSISTGLESGSIPVPECYDTLLLVLENPKGVTEAATASLMRKGSDTEPAPCAAKPIKVDAADLDELISLTGRLLGTADDLVFDQSAEVLSAVNTLAHSIRKTALSMRMISMSDTVQKLSRMIRDLARQCEKEITFASVGEHQKLDRDVVDSLYEPLMHLVRNAVDHGIEHPDVREALGKERAGRITLFIAREKSSILVALTDDGRGLNSERILEKAGAIGILNEIPAPSIAELQRLVFHPGLSTAEKVTDISGRGIGLDIVRDRIEATGGSIDITSNPGQGTTFTLRIPCTPQA
jgi:two-component system chemotaxis sensor kinase CheA